MQIFGRERLAGKCYMLETLNFFCLITEYIVKIIGSKNM